MEKIKDFFSSFCEFLNFLFVLFDCFFLIVLYQLFTVQLSCSVVSGSLWLDPMDYSTPGFPVHQNTKIMAAGPITSWQIDGGAMGLVRDFLIYLFIFWCVGGLQNHCRWWLCSHEIKGLFLLGRKVMTNLDSILKKQTLFCQQSSI